MMRWWIFLMVILVYFVYVVLGGLVFMLLERQNEIRLLQETAMYQSQWLDNNTCVTKEELSELLDKVSRTFGKGGRSGVGNHSLPLWNMYTSVYFAITVVTTIGYGNITPITTAGQWFCVFFALFGIPLALVTFTSIGLRTAYHIGKLNKICSRWGCCQRYPKTTRFFRISLVHSIFIGIIILIPAAVFQLLENWNYTDGVYYAVVTLTTIGFGDYVAGFDDSYWRHPAYRLMIAAWIILGLSWMSSFIALAQDHIASLFRKLNDVSFDNECAKGEASDDTTSIISKGNTSRA